MSGSASGAGEGLDALLPPEMARRAEEAGVQKASADALSTFTLARMFWSRVGKSGNRVVERVERVVETKNTALPSYSRIKRFAVLPVDFTEAGGELTPTEKVKRKVVAERYGDVIESLYR